MEQTFIKHNGKIYELSNDKTKYSQEYLIVINKDHMQCKIQLKLDEIDPDYEFRTQTRESVTEYIRRCAKESPSSSYSKREQLLNFFAEWQIFSGLSVDDIKVYSGIEK